MEETEYEKEENSGGAVAAGSPMQGNVGEIEENEEATTEEVERGIVAEAVTMDAGAPDVAEEEGVMVEI